MADADGEIVDPEMEVRKLQDLVRKLELQNDILRAKQSKVNVASPVLQYSSNLDDLEVVDVDDINDNEETWLYESPKQLTPEQRKQSPYQWVREPFDQSGKESVKKSLLFKLDEIVMNKKSPGSPGQGIMINMPIRYGSPISSNDSYDGPIINIPAIKQPLTSSRLNRINTDTFTRPKKVRSNNIMKYDWEGPISLDNRSTSPITVDQNENKPSNDLHSDVQEEKKVLDVHILAKMQEESLRQSFSPLNTRRRLSSRGGKNGGFYLSRDNDNSPSSNHSSPSNPDSELPPPRRIGRANSQNSVSSSSLNSNGSSTGASPPESVDMPHSEPESRLSAPRNRIRPNQSDSNLQQQINSRTITRSAGRRSPQYREGSPSQLRQPTPIMRAVSPPSKLTGIPTPARSGIPKPGAAPRSGLPTPRRSSLPVSRASRPNDESWKDGCY